MSRYLLEIAYDGTSFCGWQKQKTGTSIQQLIEEALEKILQHKAPISGSGRTDSGVHALAQMAHFDTEKELNCSKMLLALNGQLPTEIRIMRMQKVNRAFHARFSALKKIYHYRIIHGAQRDPFQRLYATSIPQKLDVAAMRQAAQFLIGRHDFSSFANSPGHLLPDEKRDLTRTLYRLILIEESEHAVRLEFEGDGFLYKMVRNITGALLCVGRHKLSPSALQAILSAKDRTKAPLAAPATGLSLISVFYPENLLFSLE